MSTERYTDRCLKIASAIDVDQLSQLSLGREIGRGENVLMRTLGEVGILGANVHCGIKLPVATKGPASAKLDLSLGLSNIERLLKYAPELADKVPYFILGLSIGKNETSGVVLTEDASHGGELTVQPLHNVQLWRKLSEAVKGSKEVIAYEEGIINSLSFLVGGEERLLDFTPPPIKPSVALSEVDEYVESRVDKGDLVLPIDPCSNLGQSLANAAV